MGAGAKNCDSNNGLRPHVETRAAAWLNQRLNRTLCIWVATEIPLPSFGLPTNLAPILLLLASNIFMTFAWYGHLKFKSAPIWIAIVVSWGIAFFEYCLAVPANRIGHGTYTAAELKTIQEVITLTVFAGFSVLYLHEPLTLNHLVGFALIVAGAYFIFRGPL
ncbi:MAG: DMT family protein [Hyphomicrobium zavarzinii]|nr:DMT family protein [Hyphomicrobium zavarzinii]